MRLREARCVMSVVRCKQNIFLFFNMDPTIVDSLASIVAKVLLHTLITVILDQPNFTTSPAQASIIDNTDALARLLFIHPETQELAQRVAFQACTEILMGEIARMGARDNRWHFSTRNASAQKIEAFSIADMSCELKMQSPHLWQILSSMLVSDSTCESQRAQYLQKDIPKGPSEMMVDTEGLEMSCSQAAQASQAWDDEDEYWACDASDADGDIEDSKVEGGGDDVEHPTKRVRRAGTWNSNLVQVVSDGFSTSSCKILTVFPENSHHCFHALDELESEMQRFTFNVWPILPLKQRPRTGYRDIGACRALYLNELNP